MATELNLNRFNWVTHACSVCASEVQVLDDDVQVGLIRCPGCGEVISGSDAENEPSGDIPVEATWLVAGDSASPFEISGGNSQTQSLVAENSKAGIDSGETQRTE